MATEPTYIELKQKINKLEHSIEVNKDMGNILSVGGDLLNYQAIFENVQVGLHIYHLEDLHDDKTLRMISSNRAAADFTGVTKNDSVGKTLDENFPGLREKGIPQTYAAVIRSGKSKILEEIHYGDDRVIDAFFSVKVFPLPNQCVGVAFDNITEIKRAEEVLIRHNELLDKKVELRTQELQRLNEHLIFSEESQRSSLASDLHDGIAQSLAMSVSKIKDIKESNGDNALKDLSDIQGHLEQSIREIRMLIYQLCPPILKDFDIDIALGFLIEQSNEKYGLNITYANHIKEDPSSLVEASKITLYRATSECINNIVKHSNTTEGFIELFKKDKTVQVKIKDNGIGFDSNKIGESQLRGFGIYSLSERLNNLGGELIVSSKPGKGTSVLIIIPN